MFAAWGRSMGRLLLMHCSQSHRNWRPGTAHGFLRCFMIHPCLLIFLIFLFCREHVPCRWQAVYCSTNHCWRSGACALQQPVVPPFQRHVSWQGHELFSNLLMQGPCHRPPCRSSFPHHQINQEPLCLFITTKTVAYIFNLVIDSVTLHHADSPHLQHEATIPHELDSMTPDAFRA